MKSQNITTLLAALCIVISFFLGYSYALREGKLQEEKKMTTPIYIDVSTSKKNITIKNTPENIFFRINGELIQSGSIDLK